MKKNILTLLAIAAFGFATNAQGDKVERSTKNVTRVITLDFMKDVHTEQNVLGNPGDIGFDFNYNKIEKGKLFEKGFSIGWQPIETTNLQILNDSMYGTLTATNQMFHLHGTLRKTILKKKPFQPYAEGLFGVKGAALTSSYAPYDMPTDHQVPFFEATWEMGCGVGFRWEFLDHLAVDMRYARVKTGDLYRVNNVVISTVQNEETGEQETVFEYEKDEWKAPLGYFRMGLSLDL